MKEGTSFIGFKLHCELLYNRKCDWCGRNCNYDVIVDVSKNLYCDCNCSCRLQLNSNHRLYFFII